MVHIIYQKTNYLIVKSHVDQFTQQDFLNDLDLTKTQHALMIQSLNLYLEAKRDKLSDCKEEIAQTQQYLNEAEDVKTHVMMILTI